MHQYRDRHGGGHRLRHRERRLPQRGGQTPEVETVGDEGDGFRPEDRHQHAAEGEDRLDRRQACRPDRPRRPERVAAERRVLEHRKAHREQHQELQPGPVEGGPGALEHRLRGQHLGRHQLVQTVGEQQRQSHHHRPEPGEVLAQVVQGLAEEPAGALRARAIRAGPFPPAAAWPPQAEDRRLDPGRQAEAPVLPPEDRHAQGEQDQGARGPKLTRTGRRQPAEVEPADRAPGDVRDHEEPHREAHPRPQAGREAGEQRGEPEHHEVARQASAPAPLQPHPTLQPGERGDDRPRQRHRQPERAGQEDQLGEEQPVPGQRPGRPERFAAGRRVVEHRPARREHSDEVPQGTERRDPPEVQDRALALVGAGLPRRLVQEHHPGGERRVEERQQRPGPPQVLAEGEPESG